MSDFGNRQNVLRKGSEVGMTEKEDTIERIERVLKLTHKKSLTVTIPRLTAERAVSMLKEQEAELSYREAKAITHTATKLDDATCPSCGNVVGEKIRTGVIWQSVVQVRWDYCRFCGQKLDWEGR